MFCPYCKCQLPENASFCQNCGANLQQYSNFLNQDFKSKVIDNNDKKKKIILIITIIVLLLLIGFGFFKNVNKKNNMNIKNEKINNKTDGSGQKDTNIDNNAEIKNDDNIKQITSEDANAPFLMIIDDVFEVFNKGIAVTGTISRGTINVNDEVHISGLSDRVLTTKVVSIEQLRKELDTASAGMEVGLYLKDVQRSDVKRGQVITKDIVTTTTRIEATLNISKLEQNENFRAIYNNSSIKIKINGIDISCFVTMLDGIQMALPGDSVNAILDLGENLTIEPGTQFSIVNNYKNIGNGSVTKVY